MGTTTNKKAATENKGNPGNAAIDAPAELQAGGDHSVASKPEATAAETAKAAPAATSGGNDQNMETISMAGQPKVDVSAAEAVETVPAFSAPSVNVFWADYEKRSDAEKLLLKTALQSYLAAIEHNEKAASAEMLTPQDQAQHEDLQKQFGKNYVRAYNGKLKTVFSAVAWANLGTNKEGWKQIVDAPPEVKALKNQK